MLRLPLPPTAAAAQAVSSNHTSQRLLELEGQLCPDSLLNRRYTFWASWRKAVAAASSPQELSPQVCVHVGQEGILRAG